MVDNWLLKPIKNKNKDLKLYENFKFENTTKFSFNSLDNFTNELFINSIISFLKTYNDTYFSLEYIKWLGKNGIIFCICEDTENGQIIGVIVGAKKNIKVLNNREHVWVISFLCVNPNYRKMGIGLSLIDFVSSVLLSKEKNQYAIFGTNKEIHTDLIPLEIKNTIQLNGKFTKCPNLSSLKLLTSYDTKYKTKLQTIIDTYYENFDTYLSISVEDFFNDVYPFTFLFYDRSFNIYLLVLRDYKQGKIPLCISFIPSDQTQFYHNLGPLLKWLIYKYKIILFSSNKYENIEDWLTKIKLNLFVMKNPYYIYIFNKDLPSCFTNISLI
jgi:hypothetical protein